MLVHLKILKLKLIKNIYGSTCQQSHIFTNSKTKLIIVITKSVDLHLSRPTYHQILKLRQIRTTAYVDLHLSRPTCIK